MEYRRFGNTIVARIDRGEEVLEQVVAIAQAEQIKLASVQALGAVGEFTVGVFHTAEKQYHANSFAGDFDRLADRHHQHDGRRILHAPAHERR